MSQASPPQPPPPYYYPPPPKPGMSTGGKLVLVGIVGFCIITGGCVACSAWIFNNAKQDPEFAKLLANSNSASTPTSPVKTTLSNADKLAQARDIMGHYTAELDLIRAKDFLSEIPEAAPEYAEAKRLINQLEPRIRKAAIDGLPALREHLAEDYRETIANANTHLNFIKKKITKVKGGYAIWAVHDFFSQYTLSMGGDAQVVKIWIVSNRADLKKAQITQVGFLGSGGFGTSCWIAIPKDF